MKLNILIMLNAELTFKYAFFFFLLFESSFESENIFF